MQEIISRAKIQNALKGRNNLDIKLENIRRNGVMLGCSGFITNKDNNKIVYINTEDTISYGYLFRYARHIKDYTGLTNRYARTKIQLIRSVLELLENKKEVI